MLPKKKVNSYLKYSGIAFQMAGIVLIAYFLGSYLDEYFQIDPPLITIFLILILFGAYMYKLYIELLKPDDQ